MERNDMDRREGTNEGSHLKTTDGLEFSRAFSPSDKRASFTWISDTAPLYQAIGDKKQQE